VVWASLQLEPTGERLFVKCDEAQSQTAGGVLLPEASAEKATSGTYFAPQLAVPQSAEGSSSREDPKPPQAERSRPEDALCVYPPQETRPCPPAATTSV
jgi:hypothetical protein